MDRRMDELSMLVNAQAYLVQGKVVLLDYPVHGNVGDLLIWKGEQVFLRSNRKDLIGQYSIKNMGKRALRKMSECDTICLHGGGNFGDLWPVHQRLRERIIAQYPHKRIIIFPQTVYYSDPAALDRACGILKRHDNLHILLRDQASLQLLRDRDVPNPTLCPDMAHVLWGRCREITRQTDRPLYLLRRDKERGHLPEACSERGSRDWEDLVEGWAAVAFKLGKLVIMKDGQHGNAFHASASWNIVANVLIRRAVRLLASHGTIVTNRLHAVILAALIRRPVVAHDNSYGKVSSYVDCWLRGVAGIQVAAAHDG